jgi:hypothetical protein
MSLFFEIYMEILQQNSSSCESEDVKNAYTELGALVGDLL